MTSIIAELPIDSIVPDSSQPRKSFDKVKLQELANSIKEHGLLQPVLVRPIGDGKYQLVHGERRFRACKLLGLETIRAEIRNLTDNETLEIQLVENLQREDLNPIEEAETFQRMINELGYTHEEIAKKIGKSREYVTNKIRLLRLPDYIKKALQEGKITEGHARTLVSLGNDKQEEIFGKILAEGLTVRQTETVKTNIVSRETSDIPINGLVIGVWISQEAYQKLSEIAKSKRTTVESFCGKIIEEVAKGVG
ncbi:MAG: ParB/RepB/Spo0J family partition protein [Candidatus Bathyarchaeia archaeon]